jgi:hypothetical protein
MRMLGGGIARAAPPETPFRHGREPFVGKGMDAAPEPPLQWGRFAIRCHGTPTGRRRTMAVFAMTRVHYPSLEVARTH